MSGNWIQLAIGILSLFFTMVLGCLWYFLKGDKPEVALWTGFVVWVLVGLIVVALFYLYVLSEPPTSGFLRPAHEPTPLTPCPKVSKDAFILLLGNSASYTTVFPHTILRVGDQDLISINRMNGGIVVSAKIYSADGKIITEILDNNFHINPSNYFRRERPDHHTLIVFDQQGQRTLYVRHINSSAIKVLGTFHTPRGIIRIEENRVVFPGNKVFTGFCFGNNKVDIQLN